MSYRNIISFRVGDQMRADLEALATARDTDVGKLLRLLVRRELADIGISPAEQREQILFLAIAMDGLLGAHADPTLRTTVIDLWRERLVEEGRRHAE
jgi:hypothetical protein